MKSDPETDPFSPQNRDLARQTDGAIVGNPSAFDGPKVSTSLTGAVACVAVIARSLSASERAEYYRILAAEMTQRSQA